MQQSAIDQLGLSPAAARVMKAQLESSLAGPNFLIALIVAYALAFIGFAIFVGVATWASWMAYREEDIRLASAALFGLPFLMIPLLVLGPAGWIAPAATPSRVHSAAIEGSAEMSALPFLWARLFLISPRHPGHAGSGLPPVFTVEGVDDGIVRHICPIEDVSGTTCRSSNFVPKARIELRTNDWLFIIRHTWCRSLIGVVVSGATGILGLPAT